MSGILRMLNACSTSKYAGVLHNVIHYERNLAHDKVLHEYNSDMQVYVDQVAVNKNFEGRAAAQETLEGKYVSSHERRAISNSWTKQSWAPSKR